MVHNNTLIALVCALLACLIWSGNFVIARSVHEWIPPFTLAFGRWTVALFALLPFSLMVLKREWQIVTAHLRYLFFMGFIGVAGFNTLIYLAAHTTTVSHIAIISAATPIFTLLIAGLVGEEKLSRYPVFGAVLACLGALTIINHGDISALFKQAWRPGDILALVAALIWAGWSVGLRFKPAGMSPVTLMTIAMIFGLLGLMPFYGWEIQAHTVDLSSWQTWSVFLYVGIAASLIAWLLWQYSVEKIGSVKTSLIYYTIPIFSSIFAALFLDESIEIYHFVGFILVFAGIVTSNMRRPTKAAYPPR